MYCLLEIQCRSHCLHLDAFLSHDQGMLAVLLAVTSSSVALATVQLLLYVQYDTSPHARHSLPTTASFSGRTLLLWLVFDQICRLQVT